MGRWAPGRLVTQVLLMLLLVVICGGALGIEGVVGIIVIMGIVIIVYALVRSVTRR